MAKSLELQSSFSLFEQLRVPFSSDDPGISIAITDPENVWQFVIHELSRRLPLRNVHWTNLVQTTQIIPELNLEFLKDSDPKISSTNKPFVYLYVVTCENLDKYKHQTKARLEHWLEHLKNLHSISKSKLSWLLVYVPLRAHSQLASTPTSDSILYTKVFEKLKRDFHVKKEGDRVCKLHLFENTSALYQPDEIPLEEQPHERLWSNLLIKLRDLVLAEFQQRCESCENQLRSSETQRMESGWDFAMFFQLKDKLAQLYRQTQLYQDASRHYDEMEAIFLSSGQSYAGFASDDESLMYSSSSVLSITYDYVQDRLRRNELCKADFHIYLFSQQVKTLLDLENYENVLLRTQQFLNTYANLRHHHELTPSKCYQLIIWRLQTLFDVAVACEHRVQVNQEKPSPSKLSIEKYARSMGDLFSQVIQLLQLAQQRYDRQYWKKWTKSSGSKSSLTSFELIRQVIATSEEDTSKCLSLVMDFYNRVLNYYKFGQRYHFLAQTYREFGQFCEKHRLFDKAIDHLQYQYRHFRQLRWPLLEKDVIKQLIRVYFKANEHQALLQLLLEQLTRVQEKKDTKDFMYLHEKMAQVFELVKGQMPLRVAFDSQSAVKWEMMFSITKVHYERKSQQLYLEFRDRLQVLNCQECEDFDLTFRQQENQVQFHLVRAEALDEDKTWRLTLEHVEEDETFSNPAFMLTFCHIAIRPSVHLEFAIDSSEIYKLEQTKFTDNNTITDQSWDKIPFESVINYIRSPWREGEQWLMEVELREKSQDPVKLTSYQVIFPPESSLQVSSGLTFDLPSFDSLSLSSGSSEPIYLTIPLQVDADFSGDMDGRIRLEYTRGANDKPMNSDLVFALPGDYRKRAIDPVVVEITSNTHVPVFQGQVIEILCRFNFPSTCKGHEMNYSVGFDCNWIVVGTQSGKVNSETTRIRALALNCGICRFPPVHLTSPEGAEILSEEAHSSAIHVYPRPRFVASMSSIAAT